MGLKACAQFQFGVNSAFNSSKIEFQDAVFQEISVQYSSFKVAFGYWTKSSECIDCLKQKYLKCIKQFKKACFHT